MRTPLRSISRCAGGAGCGRSPRSRQSSLRAAFRRALVLAALTLASLASAPTVLADTVPAAAPVIRGAGGPRDFEGLWLATRGPGGPPPPLGGAYAVRLTGTTLQCAPAQRLGGSGGGMSTLIIQGSGQIVMISEEDMDIARKIYMNALHPRHPLPQPNGHSIGHWDGDTLVVDTVAFADAQGKDLGQHTVERLRRQGDTLSDAATVTDKTGAVTERLLTWAWRPDLQFNENVCEEGFDRYQVINGQLDNPNVPPARAHGH